MLGLMFMLILSILTQVEFCFVLTLIFQQNMICKDILLVSLFDHHHHVVRPARISLTFSLHVSLSFIASGRSSGLHPISSYSCCMYVRAGCPTFDLPYAGFHRSTSLTSSSLLLQQCPACLVRLAWIVFVIGGRWPYSWCLVGCCCQDLFNIALNILIFIWYSEMTVNTTSCGVVPMV